MLLDNEKGGEPLLLPLEGRKGAADRKRAVLVGQVWSAELAETLMEIYSHLLTEGYTLEDVSHLVQDSSDDRSGD